MKPAIKSEFKKILTTRATYGISLFFLLIIIFFSFYVEGFAHIKTLATGHSVLAIKQNSLYLASSLPMISNVISVAGAFVALLLLANEYRYSTIIYTFTAITNRSRVLLAKILAILVYIFAFSLALTLLAIALMHLGVSASGHALPTQNIDYLTYIVKSVFICEAYGLAGLLFAAFIRNQIGAIAALLIIPDTIEGLLSLLLRHDTVYLPFTALQEVVQAPALSGVRSLARESSTGYLSPVHGALVFTGYLVVGWIFAWYIFLRRDAN
jgi:ABC-type transport system involved in multi-copper enzyme maturation permease subunit